MGFADECPPGKVLGQKFEVVRLLGSGGMGSVYEIEHLFTKHRRALKLLRIEALAHPNAADRFLREASAAGRIGSPHIVETFDAGTLETGEPYLVMELLKGKPLSDMIRAAGRLELEQIATLMRQAALGVQAANEAGIVHRDLKPDNLYVILRDGRPFMKILDFGISKFDSSLTDSHPVTQEGSMLGTPYYMSPEQVRGAKSLDARSDVYALGVILYECASGRIPFQADSLPHLAVLIDEAKPPPLSGLRPGLPEAFCEVVQKAMAKAPEQRFQSARDLAYALEPFAQGAQDAQSTAPERALWGAATRSSTVPRSAGGTVIMPESEPPPPMASPSGAIAVSSDGRPASLEAAALGRTLEAPRRLRVGWLLAAGGVVLGGALLVALGWSTRHRPSAEPATTASGRPAPSSEASSEAERPSIAPAVSGEPQGGALGAGALAPAHDAGSARSIPAAAAKPTASTRAAQQGLADSPY